MTNKTKDAPRKLDDRKPLTFIYFFIYFTNIGVSNVYFYLFAKTNGCQTKSNPLTQNPNSPQTLNTVPNLTISSCEAIARCRLPHLHRVAATT